jgi:hypothetical protein
MSGAIPLSPLYVFVASRGAAALFFRYHGLLCFCLNGQETTEGLGGGSCESYVR